MKTSKLFLLALICSFSAKSEISAAAYGLYTFKNFTLKESFIKHKLKGITSKDGKSIFSEELEDIENPDHGFDGGVILDFSTNNDLQIGSRMYISSNPGLDFYLAYRISNVKISAGIGAAISESKFKNKRINEELSFIFPEEFFVIRCDYYIPLSSNDPTNNMKVFLAYKASKYLIKYNNNSLIKIGTGHGIMFGISKSL